MADVDASGRGDVKRPIESTAATGARVQSGEGVFTVKNPEGEFDHQRYDASYDHSPFVSFNAPGLSVPSGGSAPVVSLNANTFNHPFKITQEEDDATGLIKTNIYYGVLRYCINSFNTVLEDDTHSVESYHSTTKSSVTTGDGSSHTHSGGTYKIPDHDHYASDPSDSSDTGLQIPTHEHSSGSTAGTSLEIPQHQHRNDDQSGGGALVGANHTHGFSFSETTGPINSGSSSCNDSNHTHSIGISQNTGLLSSGSSIAVTGNTGNVDISGSSSALLVTGRTGGVFEHDTLANKKVTGQTGPTVPQSGNLPPIPGDSGSPTAHYHPAPALSSATPTVDRFVTIKNQIAATGIMKDVGPTKGPGNTTFGFVNNADGDQTVNRVLTLPAGTFGSIFLKWKVVLPTDQDVATNFTINAADVEIHVDPDVAKTAESLSDDDTFRELKLFDANAGGDAGIDDTFDRRASAGAGETEADRTAYFYVKLGVTHNPAGGGLKAVEQITYENVYWSPLILGRAYDES
jgi:hypothetical protein